VILYSARQLAKLSKEQLIQLFLDLQNKYVEAEGKLKKKRKNKLNIKPNRKPASAKKKRKRRSLSGYGRKREKADSVVEVYPTECPDCHGALSLEENSYYSRQIIDIPLISYQTTQFDFKRGWCKACKKMVCPKKDLSHLALGKSRLGINLTSLIVVLSEEADMTVLKIKNLFKTVWGLRISTGEIINCKHEIARVFKEEYEQIKQEIREAVHKHADETSWRENGINGYVWEFVTRLSTLVVIRKSRSGNIPRQVLGEKPKGVLSTDFYAGYNKVKCPKQRCWVHLLRDVKDLTKEYPENKTVQNFYKEMSLFYKQIENGNGYKRNLVKLKWAQNRLFEIILSYAKSSACHKLINRMIKHGDELFTFLKYDGVSSSNNNEAERRLRPLVVQRKISYQTRSELGTRIKEILASISGTTKVRKQNLLQALQDRLKTAPEDLGDIQISRKKLAFDYINPP
jgi:transposase